MIIIYIDTIIAVVLTAFALLLVLLAGAIASAEIRRWIEYKDRRRG